jgi:hypothetical protein
MITVTIVETTYPPPGDDEEDYCPDGESTTEDIKVSFRDLVSMLADYPHPSCSHPTGTRWEWMQAESQQCMHTGELTERSLHFTHVNPPRLEKYWRKAMLAAIRNATRH